jgi:hypothetical protein
MKEEIRSLSTCPLGGRWSPRKILLQAHLVRTLINLAPGSPCERRHRLAERSDVAEPCIAAAAVAAAAARRRLNELGVTSSIADLRAVITRDLTSTTDKRTRKIRAGPLPDRRSQAAVDGVHGAARDWYWENCISWSPTLIHFLIRDRLSRGAANTQYNNVRQVLSWLHWALQLPIGVTDQIIRVFIRSKSTAHERWSYDYANNLQLLLQRSSVHTIQIDQTKMNFFCNVEVFWVAKGDSIWKPKFS